MATIKSVSPKGRAFRSCGCTVHYEVGLTPAERQRGDVENPGTQHTVADARREVRKIANYIESHGRGVGPRSGSTVSDRADHWLDLMGKQIQNGKLLAPNTIKGYRRNIEQHIKPTRLGNRLMSDVSTSDVDLWAGDLLSDPSVGNTYLAQTAQNLRNIFAQWIVDGGAVVNGVNPVRGRIGGGNRRNWTKRDGGEAARIRDKLPEDMRAMIDVHRYLGARGYCEVVALRTEDLLFTREAGESLAAGLARIADLTEEAYERHPVRLHIHRKLETDRTPGTVKTGNTYRTVELDQWVVASLAAHCAKWPPREGPDYTGLARKRDFDFTYQPDDGGWLFYNIRPDHGPRMYDDAAAKELEAEVARLWREHIPAGAVHGSQDTGAGTSQRALRFAVEAGRPVTSAEVAAALAITPNNASAHLTQMARTGKLVKAGTARRATWAPGPRAEMAVTEGMTVGWSRAQIAAKVGVGQHRVQLILSRIPAQPGEPQCSYGTDGRVHPRRKPGQAPALRRAVPVDDELRLWGGSIYRRHLHAAAEDAGVTLDDGQVGHLFKHLRCSELAKDPALNAADIAAFVGTSVRTIQARYFHPMDDSAARVRTAIRKAETRHAGRRHLSVVPA